MVDTAQTPVDRRHSPRLDSTTSIGSALESFDIADYVRQARARGRIQLPTQIREQACLLFRQIELFRMNNTTFPGDLDDMLELAVRVLSSEWLLSCSPLPRYRSYTNIAVLNWFLGTYRRSTYQEVWVRCATAIAVLLHDIIAFEVNSLAGRETSGTDSFDRQAVTMRVVRLRAIADTFAIADRITADQQGAPASWQGYLSRPELALVHLTAFPLTGEHDEYMFIRTLHISECCFWGILTTSLAAAESLKRGALAVAEKCLAVALPFAELLTPLILALKTMTGARFERFRQETGAASALQSRTYQLMQIALTGAHPATLETLLAIDELSELRYYDQPWFLTLADLAAPLYADGGERYLAVTGQLDALSRELRKWRKVHRGIVRNYLTTRPQGTGGTNGAEYLKYTVDTTIAGEAVHRGQDARRWRNHRYTRRSQGAPCTPAASIHARPVLGAQN